MLGWELSFSISNAKLYTVNPLGAVVQIMWLSLQLEERTCSQGMTGWISMRHSWCSSSCEEEARQRQDEAACFVATLALICC